MFFSFSTPPKTFIILTWSDLDFFLIVNLLSIHVKISSEVSFSANNLVKLSTYQTINHFPPSLQQVKAYSLLHTSEKQVLYKALKSAGK